MPTRALEVVISGDTRRMRKATSDASKDLSRFEQSGKKSLSSLKTGFLALGTAAVVGAAVGLKKSADAAIESEKANARLQAQLKALGISYQAHEGQIQRVIDKHSQLSGFDDEDLGDSFTNIVRVVGDVNKALDLNALAMDFARAKHMDVAKAGELVGKVAGGNTGILSRYGITVEKGATATEALGLLQQKFKGQAEAYGKTTAGATDRADVALENLGETIGAKVTPLIARLAEGFNTLVRQITTGEGPGGRIRDLFVGIGNTAVTAYGGIRSLVTGFQEGAAGARVLAAALGALIGGFVAFKALTTAVAAVSALRAAWVGLTAAIAANPIGALAVALAAGATALGILGVRTRSVSAAARDFNDALRSQADALRAVRDIDIDVAQRKANLKSANVAVEQAERRLHQLRKEGKGSTLEARQAEADLRQAKVAQRRATRDVTDAEEDSRRKREDATKATQDATEKTRRYNAAIQRSIDEKKKDVGALEEAISTQKRYGGNTQETRDNVEALRKKQRSLRLEIDKLESKKIVVGVKIDLSPQTIARRQATGDGIGIRGAVQSVVQTGFNSGKFGFPSGGGGSAGLDGADSDLGPFAKIGARFGLHVSSGFRRGAITSSGNPSYHGTGDAIDESGSPSGMLQYFRFLRAAFGSKLRELIYTPGGVGIKDGKPFRYTGQVAADHFDHVHVAYTGPFGDGPGKRMGDGLGKFSATSYGPPWGGIQGTGVTATGVNLKGSPHKYGIAVDPSVIALGSKVKVWPNPFGYRGAFTAFDTGGAIKGNRIDFYDWRGRRSQMGWGQRTVTISTAGSSSGGGSSAGGGTAAQQFRASQHRASTNSAAARARARSRAGNRVGHGLVGPPNSFGFGGGGNFPTPEPVPWWERETPENSAWTDAMARQAALTEQLIAVQKENGENQRKLLALASQGDQIVAAVVAAVNGGIGGRVGLGFQTPGYAGGLARY